MVAAMVYPATMPMWSMSHKPAQVSSSPQGISRAILRFAVAGPLYFTCVVRAVLSTLGYYFGMHTHTHIYIYIYMYVYNPCIYAHASIHE